ncbi:phosphoglycerate kinase [Saccharobesus litoralis]|uniref:Phosphoglycerate kinase n=1 Tax=Saccharobesus litoralis TaxID=2172099 RepID=A0A2S0VMN5_9ALTE|nr:phosphoglycerate kinase [Saccharobesus litoralis]AWB65484.1 phosphoglycerate kinase [Saccharobesus litoralis]
MPAINMTDLDLNGKRVLIRLDLNVPLDGKSITSTVRIDASIPTIQYALDQGATVLIMSHLGRPSEGSFDPTYSLAPVVEYLNGKLNKPVKLINDYLQGVDNNQEQVTVLENVRFNIGETANDPQLSQQLAALCDVFVNDAFGTVHRAHASTHGVAQYAPIAAAGPLLIKELQALSQIIAQPESPLVAIVGGAKVSSKLTVLDALANFADVIIVGGGIANTFIAAEGYNVGKSLYEPALIDEAKRLQQKTKVVYATDVVVTKQAFNEWHDQSDCQIKSISDIATDESIVDCGPETSHHISQLLSQAKTILWNGPMGVFEFDAFAKGTEVMAQAIANSQAYSVAGGGDTLAAIDKWHLADQVSYISTGGGAFLNFIEGKSLPALDILESCAEQR